MFLINKKNCVYREKMLSNSENLKIRFVIHKIKTKKKIIKKTLTYLNKTMAEKRER